MTEPRKCPLCGLGDPALFWAKVWDNPEARVFRCGACETLFLWPQLLGEKLASYYENYGEHLKKRTGGERITPDETLRRTAPHVRYRIETAKPFLSGVKRLLEVGGGSGNFIGPVVKEGLVAEGVMTEMCPERLEFVKSHFGIRCVSDLAELKGESFDAVAMFHLLEHIPNPTEFLKDCAEFLRPGGLLIVEVPCSSDPLLSLYDCAAFKDFYFQPMHQFVHCEKSLSTLAGLCGFTLKKFVPVQLYGLSNHLNWLSTGRPGGSAELAKFLGDGCESIYKKRLEETHCTDTIIGIFEKTNKTK